MMRSPYRRPDRSAGVAIGLVVISFLLMTFDIRSSQAGVAETLRNGAQTIAAPLQSVVNRVVDPIVDFGDGLANITGLREENDRLRERIDELEVQVAESENLRNTLDQALLLLGLELGEDLDEILIASQVTARGGALDLSFTIDKGRDDGVLEGHPVIDNTGALVGVISEVTAAAATVVPITSRQAPGITVRLSSGTQGSVTGQGTDRLLLQIFDPTEPVLDGTLLTTFGSDLYPRDLDVGIVLEAAVPQSGLISVDVQAVADFDRLEFVAVIPWPPDIPDEPVVVPADEQPAEGDPEEATDTTTAGDEGGDG